MLVHFVSAYVISLLTIVFLDVIWLSTMYKDFYQVNLGHLLADAPKYTAAVFFYLIYALGTTVLVVLPGLSNHQGLTKIYLTGAVLGLVAYGTYDLTNEATLKNWPTLVTLVDMVWGAFLTGVVCLVSAYGTRFFHGSP